MVPDEKKDQYCRLFEVLGHHFTTKEPSWNDVLIVFKKRRQYQSREINLDDVEACTDLSNIQKEAIYIYAKKSQSIDAMGNVTGAALKVGDRPKKMNFPI